MVITANPNQPLVISVTDATLPDMLEPNVALLNIVKGDWGINPKFKYKTARFIGGNSYYDGGSTPCLVFWWMDDDVGRKGAGSGQRYHHYTSRIFIYARDVEERWQCVLEVQRILQKYAINPRPDILRVDYYKWTPWQQPSPNQVLFRAHTDVEMIYVK